MSRFKILVHESRGKVSAMRWFPLPGEMEPLVDIFLFEVVGEAADEKDIEALNQKARDIARSHGIPFVQGLDRSK